MSDRRIRVDACPSSRRVAPVQASSTRTPVHHIGCRVASDRQEPCLSGGLDAVATERLPRAKERVLDGVVDVIGVDETGNEPADGSLRQSNRVGKGIAIAVASIEKPIRHRIHAPRKVAEGSLRSCIGEPQETRTVHRDPATKRRVLGLR